MFSFGLKALICVVMFGGWFQLEGVAIQVAQRAASIRNITVNGDEHGLDVKIVATAPIAPRTQTVTNPDRLVVDLPEALPEAGSKTILINRGKLRDVRVGLLRANPPITRVVLDLLAPTEYRVLPLANAIVVKLGDDSGVGAAPSTPTTKPPADAGAAATTSTLAADPPVESSEPSRLRWIPPILVTTTVLAMLVIAVVARIQNRRGRRGF